MINVMVFAAEGDASTDWEPVTVSCEGYIPLTDVVPDKGGNGSNDNRGGGDDNDSEEGKGNATAAGLKLFYIFCFDAFKVTG